LFHVRDFVEYGARRFADSGLIFGHGTDNALDEAVELVLAALGTGHDVEDAFWDTPVGASGKKRILKFFDERILQRKPAAYITHRAFFCSHELYVDERVLVPRSPIAELINEGFAPWLQADRVHRVLDMCTGSGCIAIACAMAFPDAVVTAVDVSDAALEVAAINRDRFQLQERLRLVKSNLFQNIEPNRYDLVVANPPYVGESQMRSLPAEYLREPGLGLRAGDDGLDVVLALLAQAGDSLRDGGVLVVEVGASRGALEAVLPAVPFVWLEFVHGGEGVFLLTAQEMNTHSALFQRLAKHRESKDNSSV